MGLLARDLFTHGNTAWYDNSHRWLQVTQPTTNYTVVTSLQFRHWYGILQKDQYAKEKRSDYYDSRRIPDCRRDSRHTQTCRGLGDTSPAAREVAWIQDRRFMAHLAQRLRRVSGWEEKYQNTRQKIKAANLAAIEQLCSSTMSYRLETCWTMVQ
jgi:hypothetical protein